MRTTGKGANALLYGVSVLGLMSAGLQSAKAQTVLDTITVVATLTEENVWNTLAPTSVVRRDDINRLMPGQITDVFFGVPGVSFQLRGDDPGASINIRGMQDFGRVAVVIDGARQNFQRSGHQADGQFYLDPEMLAGVDVVRGPTANIYGTGAIGGVVSFRTMDTDDVLKPGQRWGVLTHGMTGSNGFHGVGSIFAAARPTQNVDVIAGGVYRDRGDFKDGNGQTVLNSANDMTSGLAKVTVRPADGHEVKFSALGSETRYANGTPNATGTATVFNSTVNNYITSGRWRYSRPEDRLFDFDANVYWTQTELEQNKVAGSNNPSTGSIGSIRNFKIETVGTDVHNTSRFETGPFRHALTIGGDVFKDKVGTNDVTGSGDLFTPGGERTVGGAFAQLKTNYSTWLEIISALRYDTYDMSGGSNNAGSNGDRFSPKITVGLTPVQWLTVYGSYAEGYRAPAITEAFVLGAHPVATLPGGIDFTVFDFLQNPNLRAEVGKNKEVGVNLRFDNIWSAGDALRMKASLFRNDVDDFIEQVSIAPGDSGVGGVVCTHMFECIQYQNVPKARITGFELESRYDAGFWFLHASYTALKGTNETENVPLSKIPADTFTSTLGFRFLDRKLTTAVSLLSVSPKDPSDVPEGGVPVPGYNIVNLYLAYQFNEDVTFNAAVENLLDVYYVPYNAFSTRTTTVVPSASAGLTFKAGLRVRFGDTFYKGG